MLVTYALTKPPILEGHGTTQKCCHQKYKIPLIKALKRLYSNYIEQLKGQSRFFSILIHKEGLVKTRLPALPEWLLTTLQLS